MRHTPSSLALAAAILLSGTGFVQAGGPAMPAGAQPARTADGFIIKYRDAAMNRDYEASDSDEGARGRAQGHLNNIKNSTGAKGQLKRVRGLHNGAHLIRSDRDDEDNDEIVRRLAADPNVLYVEPNAILHAMWTPNDNNYGNQWHYSEPVAGIRAPAAWDISRGTGVVVAVVDSGITPHPDLDANVLPGYDFITNTTTSRDGNARDNNPRDEGDWFAAGECRPFGQNSSWHGTHVAGTIAAVSNNGTGVAGVAPEARIVPVRALGKCGGTVADIADAVVWSAGGTVTGIPANPNRAKVINMSLGGDGACSVTYQNAINTARNLGAVIVVAAGNEGQNASNVQPANCQNVITVAALNRVGNRALFQADGSTGSNFGAAVDIAAPGGETHTTASNGILSTLNAGATVPGAANYAYYQGTSMATPHVAGVVALMAQVRPALTHDEAEAILRSSARAFVAGSTCIGQCGAGMLDADAAVRAARDFAPSVPTTTTNGTDVNVPDNNVTGARSNIAITAAGTATKATVTVGVIHPYVGDLKLDLIAPDGTAFVLRNRTGGAADNINESYTVNLGTKTRAGTWSLRVSDLAASDIGRIDTWTLKLE